MNQLNDLDDDVRRLWRGSDTMTERELRLISRLIQEKHRSFRESVKTSNQGNWSLLFLCAAVTLWAAYRTSWFWAKLGYGVMGASFIAGMLVILAFSWRDANKPEPAVATRLYCEHLLRDYDRQIRLLTTGIWWLVAPQSAGVALIAYGVWARTGRLIISLLVGVAVPALAWITHRYMNDVWCVEPIRKKKQELVELLTEAGWEH